MGNQEFDNIRNTNQEYTKKSFNYPEKKQFTNTQRDTNRDYRDNREYKEYRKPV